MCSDFFVCDLWYHIHSEDLDTQMNQIMIIDDNAKIIARHIQERFMEWHSELPHSLYQSFSSTIR